MSRYSPQVLPNSTRGMSLIAEQLEGLRTDRIRRSEEAERDKERTYQRSLVDEQRELGDVERAKRGIHRGTAPGPIDDETYDTGMQHAFRESNAASRGTGGRGLAENMQAFLGGEPDMEPEVAALPGQFIPELGGFTPRAILRAPAAPRIGMTDPANRDNGRAMAPRFRQLTRNFYEAETETPEYEARQEREFAEARQQTELTKYIDEIVGMGVERPMASVAARNPSLLDNLLFPKKDYDKERLDETIRHNQTMEGIQRGREARLGRDGEGGSGADSKYTDLRRRAGGYVKGLVARKWSPFKDRSATYDDLIGAVQQHFNGLRPGDADAVVAEALKDRKEVGTIGGVDVNEDAPVRGEPKIVSDELLDQLDRRFNGDEEKIRAELKRRNLRIE